MAHQMSQDELEDVQEVFDLFDFWDGRDGLVDAFKVGDLLRCTGLNPTNEQVEKNGGTKKQGEKQYKFEELLPIFHDVNKNQDCGTYADFIEAFKCFDREGQGYISAAELRHVLSSLGERLSDEEVDEILKLTEMREDIDGNLKYDEFVKKVIEGPEDKKK